MLPEASKSSQKAGNILPQRVDRCIKIVQEVIDLLALDLKGINVLTEAGSGHFIFTPLIAALAGAEQVFVWTKDSVYGAGQDIVDSCRELACKLGVEHKLTFANNEQPEQHIVAADIVTNSGNIRPLNKQKLQLLHSQAVVALMYEKWEMRPADIDIDYCKERNIPVAGTWENYPSLGIFDYCEQLIIRLALEAEYEIRGNRIIVFSTDHFGSLACSGFKKMGAAAIIQTTDPGEILRHSAEADFIFFCDYMNPDKIIAVDDSVLDIEAIIQANPAIGIVHLAGDIDNSYVKSLDCSIYPDIRGHAIRMTKTLSYLGPKPVLSLLAAGLKVGEYLFRGQSHDLVQKF